MNHELDCRGYACPEPVVRCRKAIREFHPETLTVLVDNAAANENISRLLALYGYAVHSVCEGNVWTVAGTAGADADRGVSEKHLAGQTAASPAEECPQAGARRKTLVLITTDTLGRGSDELGAKLMENFLATLPELGESLWRVVLLNGGVRLTATPGKALDSLRLLEASGVDILVCGACLTFYGLLEAKAVGETTNMLDVVTSLDVADKVIRP